MKFNAMFPSKYLKADDIQGQEPVVTIESLDMERMKDKTGKEEDKWMLSFEGKEKGLILNKTNGKTLVGLFGDDTKEWMGKRIKLLTQEVEAFGERSMAIRISIQKPPQAGEAKPDSKLEKDDIPF